MEKVWSQAFKKSPFPFLGERGGIVQSEISTLGQFKQFLEAGEYRFFDFNDVKVFFHQLKSLY